MQNFQDVQNSKKIISMEDSTKVFPSNNLDVDLEAEGIYDDQDDENEDQENIGNCHQNEFQENELGLIFEEYGISEKGNESMDLNVEENICGNLVTKMNANHVVFDPVLEK
jgi:hypothetical protein